MSILICHPVPKWVLPLSLSVHSLGRDVWSNPISQGFQCKEQMQPFLFRLWWFVLSKKKPPKTSTQTKEPTQLCIVGGSVVCIRCQLSCSFTPYTLLSGRITVQTTKTWLESKVMPVPPYNYLFLLCTTLIASLPDGKVAGLAERICSSKPDLCVLPSCDRCPDTAWHESSDFCWNGWNPAATRY